MLLPSMTFVALAAALLLSPCASLAQSIETVTEQPQTLAFHASDIVHLDVGVVYANVTVRNGPQSQIIVRFRRNAASAGPELETLNSTLADGVLRIASAYPALAPRFGNECLPPGDEFGSWWLAEHQLEIDLEIPAKLIFSGRSLRGDFVLRGIRNTFAISANDGIVSIADPDANIEIRARGSTSVAAPKDGRSMNLSVYDGDLRVVAPPGTIIALDDRTLTLRLGEFEIARSDGAEAVELKMIVGTRTSLHAQLTRARFLVNGAD